MNTIQPEQTKSKTSLLKIVLAVVFFPFTLSYLILKQKQWPLIGRIAGVALLWIVFIVIGANSKSSDSSKTQSAVTEQVATPTPTIALEQKQADFKTLYKQYLTQSQKLILVQTTIQQIAKTASGKADLYLALDKVEKMQAVITDANMGIDTPASLKEYGQIDEALTAFRVAGDNFSGAIQNMKDYVNKEDLDKLAQARDQMDQGVANLTDSKNTMDSVAKKLGVDVSQITGIELK